MASEVETLEGKKQEDDPKVEEDEVEVKDKEEPEKEDEEEQETKEKESDGEEEEDDEEEADESKGSSKRGRKYSSKKGDGSSKKVKTDSSTKEPVTPIERPTRERKTVERYTESMNRLSATKPFSIEKGSGTQLKDIPNVAYKLSKRKPDDNLHSLHTILFNKRGKVNILKKNIGMFSGFVWADDEQFKQRTKVKEKLDKCTKERLFDFCDILNLQINKSSLKKEEVSLKLLEFLQSPHVTTEVLLAEEQKGKKRKVKSRRSRTPSTKKSGEKRKRPSKVQEENNVDEDEGSESEDEGSEEEDEKNTPLKPESEEDKEEGGDDDDDEVPEEEDDEEPEKTSSKKNVKKDSGTKTGEKSKAIKKDDVKSPTKSNKKSKKDDITGGTPVSVSKSKVSSSKKSKEEKSSKKIETKGSAKKDSSKKDTTKDQGKGKTNKKAKAEPTKEEMHAVVVSILKEVDFNTATLSDIIKQLGTHFGQDLLHRKAEVKAIITDVINSMSGDEDEEEEKEAGGSDEDGDGDNSDS